MGPALPIVFVLLALCCPPAASQAPTTLSQLFSNDGPTFIATNADWTLYLPLATTKNSGKVGILNIGASTYTFLAPRNKVPKQLKDGTFRAPAIFMRKVALTSATISAAKTSNTTTMSMVARPSKGAAQDLSKSASPLNGSLPQQLLFGESTFALTGGSLKFSGAPRLRTGKNTTKLSTQGVTYYVVTAGKVATVCRDGYGGGKGSSECKKCNAGQFGKQLSISQACPSCLSLGPAMYSASAGASACSVCPAPQAAKPSADACGSGANVSFSVIVATTGGCTKQLTDVLTAGYNKFVSSQPSVVPASVKSEAACTQLARRRQLFRVLQQGTTLTRLSLGGFTSFESFNPVLVSTTLIAGLGSIASASFGLAGLRVDVLSATGSFTGGSAANCPAAGLPTLSNGDWPASCDNKNSGQICTGVCKSGFVGSPTTSCRSDGGWSTISGACTASPPATCPSTGLPTLSNGDWPASCNNLDAGKTCTGVCKSGFVGSPTTSCGTNGGWSTISGACTASPPAVKCPASALPTLANGTWPSSCDNAAVNAECPGSCDSGYSGTPKVTCQASGQWSSISGTCEVALGAAYFEGTRCMFFSLPDLENGDWPVTCDDAPEGTLCSGSCATGSSGMPTATCGSSGKWSMSGGCKS